MSLSPFSDDFSSSSPTSSDRKENPPNLSPSPKQRVAYKKIYSRNGWYVMKIVPLSRNSSKLPNPDFDSTPSSSSPSSSLLQEQKQENSSPSSPSSPSSSLLQEQKQENSSPSSPSSSLLQEQKQEKLSSSPSSPSSSPSLPSSSVLQEQKEGNFSPSSNKEDSHPHRRGISLRRPNSLKRKRIRLKSS